MATRYDARQVMGQGLDAIDHIKDLAEELAQAIESNGTSRENSIALTHLETAVMYATRHVSNKHSSRE